MTLEHVSWSNHETICFPSWKTTSLRFWSLAWVCAVWGLPGFMSYWDYDRASVLSYACCLMWKGGEVSKHRCFMVSSCCTVGGGIGPKCCQTLMFWTFDLLINWFLYWYDWLIFNTIAQNVLLEPPVHDEVYTVRVVTCLQFILIFHKAQNSSLRHVGLIDIYRQMHLFDEEQEAVIPAISAFKAQVTS